MNKQFFGLLTVMLTFWVSCSDNNLDTEQEEMVNFTIETAIPADITTYASHEGGIANVKSDKYSLRYIMEVWTQETPKRLAYRDTKIVPDFNVNGTNVTFTVQLLARIYDFVFWADFVDKGSPGVVDKFYNTNAKGLTLTDPGYLGLRDIQIKSYAISNEARDAFFAVKKNVDLSHSSRLYGGITLARPFGKYRVIATNTPSTVSMDEIRIDYSVMGASATLPAGFDALEDTLTGVTIPAAIYPGKTIHDDVEAGGIVLAFDYIFVPESAPQTVRFNATVYDGTVATGASIGEFTIPNIRVERNKLTTVVGKFFTN